MSTVPTMMPFVLIGGIGVVILVLSVLIDGLLDGLHILEVVDIFDGAVSAMAIGAGLTIVGATGFGLGYIAPLWLTWTLALLVGVAAWLGVALLIRWLRHHSSAPVGNSINARGTTLCALSPLGEVRLTGDINKRLARCEGPALAQGTPIRVIDIDGPYLVVISDESPASTVSEPWPHLPQGE